MSDFELQLAVYQNADRAARVLQELKLAEEDGVLRIFNAAVLSKDASGRTELQEDRDISPGFGSVFGGLVGGLLGLMAGPGGAIFGLAAGAAAGAVVAGRIDLGFDDRFLQEVRSILKPGTSVVMILVEAHYAQAAAEILADPDGKVLRQVVRSDVVEKLRSALDE